MPSGPGAFSRQLCTGWLQPAVAGAAAGRRPLISIELLKGTTRVQTNSLGGQGTSVRDQGEGPG